MNIMKSWAVATRQVVRSLALLVVAAPSVASAAPAVNFDFTNGTSSTSAFAVLSSPGGTHWNRAGEADFGLGLPGVTVNNLDEFGQPQSGPYEALPISLRQSLLNSFGMSPIVGYSDDPLGSMTIDPNLGSQFNPAIAPVLEIIGAKLGVKYDVAVYVANGPDLTAETASHLVQLSIFPGSGTPVASPLPVIRSPAGFGSDIYRLIWWRNLTPMEMHIGPPGAEPLGWALDVLRAPAPTISPAVRIAAIQIREAVPEPAAGLVMAMGSLPLACARRRR